MSKYSNVDTTTNEWNSIPFEVDGVNFVSKVKKNSEMGMRISQVPVRIFQEMNVGAIRSCIGNPSLMTRDELIKELYRCNIGGSQAILELA